MKKTLALFLLLSATLIAAAQETPRWIRKSAISPDGSSIAFCYKGDIFIVGTAGGRDLQVTVRTVRGHAVASCFLPGSLFDE